MNEREYADREWTYFVQAQVSQAKHESIYNKFCEWYEEDAFDKDKALRQTLPVEEQEMIPAL